MTKIKPKLGITKTRKCSFCKRNVKNTKASLSKHRNNAKCKKSFSKFLNLKPGRPKKYSKTEAKKRAIASNKERGARYRLKKAQEKSGQTQSTKNEMKESGMMGNDLMKSDMAEYDEVIQ